MFSYFPYTTHGMERTNLPGEVLSVFLGHRTLRLHWCAQSTCFLCPGPNPETRSGRTAAYAACANCVAIKVLVSFLRGPRPTTTCIFRFRYPVETKSAPYLVLKDPLFYTNNSDYSKTKPRNQLKILVS